MARKRKAHSRKPATSIAGRNTTHKPFVPAKKKASGAGASSSHVPPIRVNFMGWRYIAGVLSLLLLVMSFVSLGVWKLNFGLDFTGGTLVEVAYATPVRVSDIRSSLDASGYAGATVVHYGSDKELLIRLPQSEDIAVGDEIVALLREGAQGASAALRRVEFVGPQVGSELREQGGLALLTALGLVMLYVAFRFQFKFALSAVAALFHDVIIVFGIFSLMRWNFDLTVLAALLAVIGYSLNDTIVVSDRIRENFYRFERITPLQIINVSLNQTLVRTLITSLTTLLVLLSLLLLGGDQVRGFATALAIGVVVGTYSSIYVSANLLLLLGLSKDDLADERSDKHAGGEL